jgi:hypothetical protein
MPTFELIVDRVIDDGRFVIVNNSSTPVPLGAVFTELQSRLVQREGEMFRELPLSAPEPINLELVEVESWRKLVGEVPKGHNAAVRFKGEGIERLQQHILERQKATFVFVASAQAVA